MCGFMHAADSGISVTSNSYYTDPWLFACKNDPAQNAIFTAVNRCGRLARSPNPQLPCTSPAFVCCGLQQPAL